MVGLEGGGGGGGNGGGLEDKGSGEGRLLRWSRGQGKTDCVRNKNTVLRLFSSSERWFA